MGWGKINPWIIIFCIFPISVKTVLEGPEGIHIQEYSGF